MELGNGNDDDGDGWVIFNSRAHAILRAHACASEDALLLQDKSNPALALIAWSNFALSTASFVYLGSWAIVGRVYSKF
jgi:hypothetical protein